MECRCGGTRHKTYCIRCQLRLSLQWSRVFVYAAVDALPGSGPPSVVATLELRHGVASRYQSIHLSSLRIVQTAR